MLWLSYLRFYSQRVVRHKTWGPAFLNVYQSALSLHSEIFSVIYLISAPEGRERLANRTKYICGSVRDWTVKRRQRHLLKLVSRLDCPWYYECFHFESEIRMLLWEHPMCKYLGINSIVVYIWAKEKSKRVSHLKTRGEWQWENADKHLITIDRHNGGHPIDSDILLRK